MAHGDLAAGPRPWRTEMVQVSGGRLRARHRPGRLPAVVFESGLGLPGSLWEPVCERLPPDLALVCYDRAGLGGSDPGRLPRSGVPLAAELSQLLRHLALPPPYVLVGHSAGAFVARLFAAARPGDVSGLVLVDPAQEDSPTSPGLELLTNALLRLLAAVARTGVAGGIVCTGTRWLAVLPAPRSRRRVRLLTDAATPAHLTGILHENQAYPGTVAQVRQAAPLPDVALCVITAVPRRHPWRKAPRTPDRSVRRDVALARTSSRGRHLLAPGSGHLVPLDAPQLVADAVIEVLR